MYWQLACKTCNKTAPYVATTREEMEYPYVEYVCDYYQLNAVQERAVDAVQAFRDKHEGHELVVEEA